MKIKVEHKIKNNSAIANITVTYSNTFEVHDFSGSTDEELVKFLESKAEESGYNDVVEYLSCEDYIDYNAIKELDIELITTKVLD